MKLDQNSLTAKLYRWFYGDSKMPNNLCPYFWKLVTAIIFGLPFAIYTLPHSLLYYRDDNRDSISDRLAISSGLWILVLGLISMILTVASFFISLEKNSYYYNMSGIGMVLWLIVIIAGIIYLFKHLKEKWQNRDLRIYTDENGRTWVRPREKRANIIVEMVKAKYNKYCPKIDWN